MKNVNDSSAVAYASVPTQHNYNGGVFPEIVVNNEGCTTVEETVAFVKANQSELEAKLAKSGALLFRGFPIDSAEQASAILTLPIRSRCLMPCVLTLLSAYSQQMKRRKT